MYKYKYKRWKTLRITMNLKGCMSSTLQREMMTHVISPRGIVRHSHILTCLACSTAYASLVCHSLWIPQWLYGLYIIHRDSWQLPRIALITTYSCTTLPLRPCVPATRFGLPTVLGQPTPLETLHSVWAYSFGLQQGISGTLLTHAAWVPAHLLPCLHGGSRAGLCIPALCNRDRHRRVMLCRR